MPLPIGFIVEPLYLYPRIDGSMQDWAGYRSAKGYISATLGTPGTTGAAYFDATTSASTAAPAKPGVEYYTLVVWDIDSRAMVSATYPETEFIQASVGTDLVTVLATDLSTEQLANMIQTR